MAKGTDTLAVRYADERKLTKIMFPLIGKNIHVWQEFCEMRIR